MTLAERHVPALSAEQEMVAVLEHERVGGLSDARGLVLREHLLLARVLAWRERRSACHLTECRVAGAHMVPGLQRESAKRRGRKP